MGRIYSAGVSLFVKVAQLYKLGVRVAQLEEAWAVEHAVGKSNPACAKLTKSFQQAFNPKIAGSFRSRPKIEGSVYHNKTVGTLTFLASPWRTCGVITIEGLQFHYDAYGRHYLLAQFAINQSMKFTGVNTLNKRQIS